MKIILVGHPRSQKVVPASKHLVNKYMSGFDVEWINFTGDTKDWSAYVADYLEGMEDSHLIFALDDYLLAGSAHLPIPYGDYDCIKLCECTKEENDEYPVTTQYSLWKKDSLVKILRQTTTPWDFEIKGSEIFKREEMKFGWYPILRYNTSSSLSKR